MIPEIKYTWSSDGVNWSRPKLLGFGFSPTIAVDDAGGIGVAYIGGPYSLHTGAPVFNTGTVYYLAKVPDPTNSNPWSGTFQIDTTNVAHEPALAGHRKDMHLAVAHSDGVRYYTFPTFFPPPAATISYEEVFKFSPLLAYNEVTLPSIAVARRDECDEEPPIVRIGFYFDGDYGNFFHLAGVLVAERPLNVVNNLWNAIIYNDVQFAPTAPILPAFAKGYSTSLTANKLKGEFYFGYSKRYGTTPETKIVHGNQNTWSNPHVVNTPFGTSIDVKAYNHRLVSRFKYAVQPRSSLPANNFITLSWIDLQEGKWDGTSPPSWYPQFTTPYSMASNLVREPDLVYYMNRNRKGIHGVFERWVTGPSNSGQIESDYAVCYPNDSPMFPPPSPPDCERNRTAKEQQEIAEYFWRGYVADWPGYFTDKRLPNDGGKIETLEK